MGVNINLDPKLDKVDIMFNNPWHACCRDPISCNDILGMPRASPHIIHPILYLYITNVAITKNIPSLSLSGHTKEMHNGGDPSIYM